MTRCRAARREGVPLHAPEARILSIPGGVVLAPSWHEKIVVWGVENNAVVANLLHAFVVHLAECVGVGILRGDVCQVALQARAS